MFGRTRAVLACSVFVFWPALCIRISAASSAQVKSEARRSDGRLLANPRDGLRVVDATDNGGIHRSVGRVRSVARSAGRSACLRRRQRRMHGCRLPGSSQGRRQGARHHSQNVLQAWRIVPHGGKCELAHPRSSSRTRLSLRARRADKPVLAACNAQAAELESLEIVEGKDLTLRKRRLLDAGDCLVTLPGGVGTFDEV